MTDLEATARAIVIDVMGAVYLDTFVGVVLCNRIAQALAAEREACALVLDAIVERVSRGGNDMFVTALLAELKQAATAIRARNEPEQEGK